MRLIRADDRPMKIKPDQPGGMPVPDQNVSVYDQKLGAAAVEKLLPLDAGNEFQGAITSTTWTIVVEQEAGNA